LLSVAILAFVATTSLWVAVPAMVVCGFAMAGTGMASQTMIHLVVTPMMRGRVLSMHGVIFRGGPALGALAMGAASDHLGLRLPSALGALLILGAVAVMLTRVKALAEAMRLEDAKDE
jgi:MFS family permease